jgi:solute carrier family 10 (sodium/bile acid cotransporter), member 7
MMVFLRRRWFLLLIAAGVALALAQTDLLRAVVSPIPPRGVVALTLFLMAWSLESRKLFDSLKRPGPALWAMAVSYVLLPALGYVASRFFTLRDLQIGLLVATSVPCTLASAMIWTRLAGGDEAVALLVIMLTTSLSWIVTTTWLTALTGAVVVLDPGRMMLDLLVFLVLPIALGQLARSPERLRGLAVRGKIALSVLSRLLILTIILQAVVMAVDRLRETLASDVLVQLMAVAVAGLAVHLTALAVGFFGGKLFGFDRARRIAVAFACSQKTLPVGIMLIDAYYRDYALAVVPMLFYHIGQLIVDTYIAESLAARGEAPRLVSDVHAGTRDRLRRGDL